jgi:hypothetical protein
MSVWQSAATFGGQKLQKAEICPSVLVLIRLIAWFVHVSFD